MSERMGNVFERIDAKLEESEGMKEKLSEIAYIIKMLGEVEAQWHPLKE
jgi:hypothetical protein